METMPIPGKCVMDKIHSWVRIPLSPLKISKLSIKKELNLLIIIKIKGSKRAYLVLFFTFQTFQIRAFTYVNSSSNQEQDY